MQLWDSANSFLGGVAQFPPSITSPSSDPETSMARVGHIMFLLLGGSWFLGMELPPTFRRWRIFYANMREALFCISSIQLLGSPIIWVEHFSTCSSVTHRFTRMGCKWYGDMRRDSYALIRTSHWHGILTSCDQWLVDARSLVDPMDD